MSNSTAFIPASSIGASVAATKERFVSLLDVNMLQENYTWTYKNDQSPSSFRNQQISNSAALRDRCKTFALLDGNSSYFSVNFKSVADEQVPDYMLRYIAVNYSRPNYYISTSATVDRVPITDSVYKHTTFYKYPGMLRDYVSGSGTKFSVGFFEPVVSDAASNWQMDAAARGLAYLLAYSSLFIYLWGRERDPYLILESKSLITQESFMKNLKSILKYDVPFKVHHEISLEMAAIARKAADGNDWISIRKLKNYLWHFFYLHYCCSIYLVFIYSVFGALALLGAEIILLGMMAALWILDRLDPRATVGAYPLLREMIRELADRPVTGSTAEVEAQSSSKASSKYKNTYKNLFAEERVELVSTGFDMCVHVCLFLSLERTKILCVGICSLFFCS